MLMKKELETATAELTAVRTQLQSEQAAVTQLRRSAKWNYKLADQLTKQINELRSRNDDYQAQLEALQNSSKPDEDSDTQGSNTQGSSEDSSTDSVLYLNTPIPANVRSLLEK